MISRIFRLQVSGCVGDACKVQVVQWNVAFVRIEVELSNKPMTDDGHMLFVVFGYLKFALLIPSFLNLLIALIIFLQLDGSSVVEFVNNGVSELVFSVINPIVTLLFTSLVAFLPVSFQFFALEFKIRYPFTYLLNHF